MLTKKAILRSNKNVLRRFYSKTTNSQNSWKSVVGLEVHAQISSESKLFSGSSTAFSSPVNTNVAFFDCSIPGTLPVLNKKCVETGVLTALSLNCKVNPVSHFDRKHYFYADLPNGYQITQQRSPLAVNGVLEFQVFTPGIHKTPYKNSVRIKQLQLEQDSGKSLHDVDRSLVDLNRAGAPLMELVFEPDLSDGEEAAALVKELIIILQRIKACSCKMEEGALRVDANVSVHKKGTPLGTRTEIKNIGSVRGVAGAIKHEIERQIKILEKGGRIINETRSWDAANRITVAMRDKEVVQDYRYMPEPNLPPLHIAMGPVETGYVNVEDIKQKIPELPNQTRIRLKSEHLLTTEQAIILVNDFSMLSIFEHTVGQRKQIDAKLLANFLINDVNSIFNKKNIEFEDVDFVNIDFYGEIIELVQNSIINRTTAKLLLEEMFSGNKSSPTEIVASKNWKRITDEAELTKICKEILEQNDKAVKSYRNGKTKVFKAFLGAVSSKTQNCADMAKVDRILKELLKQ